MSITHNFPDISKGSEYVLPKEPTYIDRPENLEKIQSGLSAVNAVLITGDAGVGKNALARDVIPKMRELSSKRLLLCEITAEELVAAGRPLAGLFRVLCSTLKTNRDLNFTGKSWFHIHVESILTASEFLRDLGSFLHDNNTQLLISLRSFHRLWWNDDLQEEYFASGGTEGRLAELIHTLGLLQRPALNSGAGWAKAIFVMIAGRNLADACRTYHAVSGFRPRVVVVPKLSETELKDVLDRGYEDTWNNLTPDNQENLIRVVQENTASLPQSVQANCRYIGDSVNDLTAQSLSALRLRPFVVEEKHKMELYQQAQTVVSCVETESWLDPLSEAVWSRLNDDFQLTTRTLPDLIKNKTQLISNEGPNNSIEIELAQINVGIRRVQIAFSADELQLKPQTKHGEITFDARLFWVWGSVRSTQRFVSNRADTAKTKARNLERLAHAPSIPLITQKTKRDIQALRQLVFDAIGSYATTEADLFLRLRDAEISTSDIATALSDLMKTTSIERAFSSEQRLGGRVIRAYRRR